MRTFADIVADIDRELAAVDMIPTDEPAAIAAYLRALLTRYTLTLPDLNGGEVAIVPAAAIRLELSHLTQDSQP
ncbi:hypothetical protein Amsp01_090380 [Amycolatopsis sp. NBRC 101858]|uniref:hypothetical protein n=1 Tax=Amycolatopsis sp. NBRC 101858 TaxID=3032200 RepID=UPI0024A3F6BC|nr:hypothetical protein [Amycolatopsis sp. NBRC 101858]GLY43015.1 hypothetical protein Amsp01_090380 [Amycolatopsis sp. NBRC 101858]